MANPAATVQSPGRNRRNHPCHCGSGRKFKLCCDRLVAKAAPPPPPQPLPAEVAAQQHNALARSLSGMGHMEASTGLMREACRLWPSGRWAAQYNSDFLFSLHYRAYDRAAVFAEHRAWAERHSLPQLPAVRHRHAKPRVGLVSTEVRDGPVARFFLPFLRHRDRERFDVTIYACQDRAQEDGVTETMRTLADHFRAAPFDGAAGLARCIRNDEIDLLVDLAGHLGGFVLPALSMRPAPVQVGYLDGSLGTSGVSAIDYQITDALADPDGDEFFTEKLWRVPAPFYCYEPPAGCPEVMPAPALRNGYVTFGSFNRLSKHSPETLATWNRILEAVPQSRLLLKAKVLGIPDSHAEVRSWFPAVDPSRIECVGTGPSPDYLRDYGRVDIALDSTPYAGGVTTCEALWMGVPVVTLNGDRHAARVGTSILGALGLPALVARDADQYVAIAQRLANAGPERLNGMRRSMRARIYHRGLTDGPRFARKMEDAFAAMLHAGQRGDVHWMLR
jgi:protein O-GlcNAc transferase